MELSEEQFRRYARHLGEAVDVERLPRPVDAIVDLRGRKSESDPDSRQSVNLAEGPKHDHTSSLFDVFDAVREIGKMARDFRAALETAARSNARFIWLGALAVIAAVLAEGFFEYNLGDSEVLTMFLATMTCGYVAIGSRE